MSHIAKLETSKRLQKTINLKIHLVCGGAYASFPYYAKRAGDFKLDSIKWKKIKIEKDVYMIYAISRKANQIAIHTIWRKKKISKGEL